MTYKRILVAVDGSKTSQVAFKEALHLAKAYRAKLYILHVIERLPDHVAYAINVQEYQTSAHENAMQLLKKFSQLAIKQKIPYETKLIEIINFKETVAKKILKTIKSLKADVLVMGTHGRTGFSRFMLGSVAEELLKTSPIPLLVTRSG